jgi:ribosomal protein S21
LRVAAGIGGVGGGAEGRGGRNWRAERAAGGPFFFFGWGGSAAAAVPPARSFVPLLPLSLSPQVAIGNDEHPEAAVKRFRRSATNAAVVNEARRRRQFENSQDRAKRRDKEVRMRRSKKYQYQATTAEEGAASLEPAPFGDMFTPSAEAFVGSLGG